MSKVDKWLKEKREFDKEKFLCKTNEWGIFMTTPTQEQIERITSTNKKIGLEEDELQEMIKLSWKQAQAEERKRILEIIENKLLLLENERAYDSEETARKDGSIYELEELKAQINQEDKT